MEKYYSSITLMPKLTTAEVFLFLVQFIALLGFAKLFGELAKKFKLPAVIGEIFGGIILGPTILGTLFPGAFKWLFFSATGATVALDGLILLAMIFLLFVVGLEIDVESIKRQKKAVGSIGVLGIIIPLVVGSGAGWLLYSFLDLPISQGVFAIFFGAALSISALPVIARVLMDLDLLKTKIGNLIVAIATINDVVGWLLFTLALSLSGLSAQHVNIGLTIVLTLVLAVLSVTLFRTGMNWLLGKVNKVFNNTQGAVLGTTLVIMMLASLLTEHIGVHAVFGAFLIGIAVTDSKHFTHQMKEHIHQFTTHILAPLFFAAVGLKVNFFADFNFMIVMVTLILAYVTKMAAGLWGGKIAGLTRKESIAAGLGISARGGMGVILAIIAFNSGLINGVVFEALVIMALVTSVSAALIKRYVDSASANNAPASTSSSEQA